MYAYIHTFKIAISLVNSLTSEHDCVFQFCYLQETLNEPLNFPVGDDSR